MASKWMRNSQTSIEWKYLGPGPSPDSTLSHTLVDRSIAHISDVSRRVWTYFPPKRKMVGG
jgi:hypothetical protein